MTPASDRPENPSGPPNRCDGTPDEGPIWCTQWPSNSKNIFSVFYDDSTPDAVAFGRTWKAGDPLYADNIPSWLMLEKGRPAPKGDLFSIANGVMVVSERLADIFRQFDLGPAPTEEEPRPRRTELHTMPLFAHDERTLIRKVVLLQCSAHQDVFVPEETKKPKLHGGRVWSVSFARDDQIAVRRPPLGGPDFWRDPLLVHTWFCSNRLYQAIKKAGIKPLDFYSCRIVD